jgi:hypothetical protein
MAQKERYLDFNEFFVSCLPHKRNTNSISKLYKNEREVTWIEAS